jgi:hypothetical protein
MLDTAGVTAADYVVDVGDGASRLVDVLVARGFQALIVVDASADTERVTEERLGELACQLRSLVRDVLVRTGPHRAVLA